MAKTVLVHDYFTIKGGGERLSLTLANALDMDLLYAYRGPQTFDDTFFPPRHRALLSPETGGTPAGKLWALAKYIAARDEMARYDTRIFTGNFAPLAAPRKGAGGGRNIQYINTPPRPLYDQKDFYLARAGAVKRMAIHTLGPMYRALYEQCVARMDVLISNSENIRARVQHFLGYDSHVVYPPCDIDRYSWGGQGDFYLSTARMTPLKRVGMIVDAFIRMPDKKLVVASGGTEAEGLKARAANSPNITFTGWTDDAQLVDLMGRAIATIYIPKDEDFGISPVESMAAGKPVIGVAEGGIKETVLDGTTGVLLKTDFTVDDLVAAIHMLSPDKALTMRADCESRARAFSREAFLAGMKAILG